MQTSVWKQKCEEKQYEQKKKKGIATSLKSSAKLILYNNSNPGRNMDRNCYYFTISLNLSFKVGSSDGK